MGVLLGLPDRVQSAGGTDSQPPAPTAMSQDTPLELAYVDSVRSRPKKRRPVRVTLSVPRATQLRNALAHIEDVVGETPRPSVAPNADALAILRAFTDALSTVLPPQLITPAGPSK